MITFICRLILYFISFSTLRVTEARMILLKETPVILEYHLSEL